MPLTINAKVTRLRFVARSGKFAALVAAWDRDSAAAESLPVNWGTFAVKDQLVASLAVPVVPRGFVVNLRTLSVAMAENFVVARPTCVAQADNSALILWRIVHRTASED
jgi:hypothetical protein